MKLLQTTFILFLLVASSHTFGQSLKITSVGSADNYSAKLLEKQLVGKELELTLFQDSALVVIAPLHQKEKMKQTGVNQYMRTDSTDTGKSSSELTLLKTKGQLSSINLKLISTSQAGDKTEIWIIAKP